MVPVSDFCTCMFLPNILQMLKCWSIVLDGKQMRNCAKIKTSAPKDGTLQKDAIFLAF